jgi:hypothetical protein
MNKDESVPHRLALLILPREPSDDDDLEELLCALLDPFAIDFEPAPVRNYASQEVLIDLLAGVPVDFGDPAHVVSVLRDVLLNQGWDADDVAMVGFDDEGIYMVTMENPDTRWEWMRLGGRWAGHLHLKPNAGNSFLGLDMLHNPRDFQGRADACRVGDLEPGFIPRVHDVLGEGVWREVTDRSEHHNTLPPDPDPWIIELLETAQPDQWVAVVDYCIRTAESPTGE